MKVGNYVRTKGGKIFKWNNLCTIDKKDYEEHTRKILFIEDEIKSSPNIINLIEVGDYVNGVRVDEIIYIGHGTIKDLEISFRYKYAFEKDDVYTLKEQDIKSIVTKEQFESMEYKLEVKDE